MLLSIRKRQFSGEWMAYGVRLKKARRRHLLCARAGSTGEDCEALSASTPTTDACITRSIRAVVMRQKSALSGLPPSVTASLYRSADGVAQAIKWHSGGLVGEPDELRRQV